MNRTTERIVREAWDALRDRNEVPESVTSDEMVAKVFTQDENGSLVSIFLDEVVFIAAEEGYENGLYDHLEGKR